MLSLLAGLSTVIGSFIVFFSKSKSKKLLTFALSFSAGIMITLSFTDLYPFSQRILVAKKGPFTGILLSLLFLLIGVIISMLIDYLVCTEVHLDTKKNYSEKSLYKVGLISMVALILHNFPEGIATFMSSYQNTTLGIYVTIAISLHNIPEGISIAMPIYYSTSSKFKAIKYTFYSGMAEPFGAFLAFLFLKPFISDITLGIIFAIVAGIMLYIAFQELIPEARSYKHTRVYIFSLLLGICIIPISHIFIG
jgi:ZIP family zinc transporter